MSKASEFEKHSKKIWKLADQQKASIKELDDSFPKELGNNQVGLRLLGPMFGGPVAIISKDRDSLHLDFKDAKVLGELLTEFFKETE